MGPTENSLGTSQNKAGERRALKQKSQKIEGEYSHQARVIGPPRHLPGEGGTRGKR